MKNKIYIVTSGEYSDYHICAVFSNKEKAEEYVQYHGTEHSVEEYCIDEEIKSDVKLWRIIFYIKNGEVIEACPTEYRAEEKCDTCKVCETLRSELIIYFYVTSETSNKAIKIASERWAAIKSNDYIWLRLTRPCLVNGKPQYERFNVKTNEFLHDDT